MRSYMVNADVIEKIMDLAEIVSDGTDLTNDTIRGIRRVAIDAGENGWVVLSSQPSRRKKRPWGKGEERRFLKIIRAYIGTPHWEHGKQKRVWENLSSEFDRPPSSLKNKYAEFKRRGMLE